MLQDGLLIEHSVEKIRIKENLNFKDIVNNYKPGINIRIGKGYSQESFTTDPFTIKDIEKSLDDILPTITKHLPIDKIIWDLSRGERQFSNKDKIREYNLKLILK